MHVRRLLLVLALTAVASPSVTRAQGRPAIGLLAGFESVGGDGGLSLRLDGAFPLRPIAPQIGLAIVGSVGYTHVSHDTYNWWWGENWNYTTNIFRISPAMRFTLGNSPSIQPYADAGLGLYVASTHVDYIDPYSGYNMGGADRSDSGLFLRLAAGILFQLSPALSLGAEVGIDPAFGYLDTGYHAMAELQFKM